MLRNLCNKFHNKLDYLIFRILKNKTSKISLKINFFLFFNNFFRLFSKSHILMPSIQGEIDIGTYIRILKPQ
jgi:hypothetical protein